MLGYFNQINALFQSKSSLIGLLHDESVRITRVICKNFVKPNFVGDLSKLEPDNVNHLPLKQVNMGRECESLLSSLNDEEHVEHFRRCLSFYKTAVVELRNRLPLFDPLFKVMIFVSPKIALDMDSRIIVPKLDSLVVKHGHLLESPDDVHQEWEDLPAYFSSDERNVLLKKDSEEFWFHLSTMKNFSDKYVFRSIASLAKIILSAAF